MRVNQLMLRRRPRGTSSSPNKLMVWKKTGLDYPRLRHDKRSGRIVSVPRASIKEILLGGGLSSQARSWIDKEVNPR